MVRFQKSFKNPLNLGKKKNGYLILMTFKLRKMKVILKGSETRMMQDYFFPAQDTVYWTTCLIVSIKPMMMEMFIMCLPCKRQDAKHFRLLC